MSNLLEKASIVTTPTAYDNGKILSVKPVQTFGSELITNGSFDTDLSGWTYSSGVTWNNGKAEVDALDGSFKYIEQIITSSGTKTYKISFEISNIQGSMQLTEGTSLVTEKSTNGTFEVYYKTTTTNPAIQFKRKFGTNTFFELDNVSVKEVIDADFDFTRNSSATRVNSQGLIEDMQILSSNLVTNGDFSQEGSELVTNGTFDDGLNGWTSHSGSTLELENGMAKITTVGAQGFIKRTDLSIETGKTYFCQAYITNALSPVWFLNGVSNLINLSLISENTYGGYITTTGNNSTFYIRGNNTDGEVSYIDNVSVKEVGQDWSITGTGWNISDNGLSGLAAEENVTQSISTIVGKKYVIKFTISNWVSGDVYVRPNNSAGTQFYVNGNGTYTEEFTGVSSSPTLVIRARPSIPFTGTISNISLIEITDDTNLPRINYEGFSYQDALGSELVTNGNFSNGSTGWTIINGTVTDKYNASMTSYQSGIRIAPFSKTGTFKVVFDLVVTSGSCKFDAGGSNNAIYSTSGTKEIIVTNTTKFEFNAFNLGWVGTLDNVSVKEYLGQEVVPDSGYGSWLFEPQSTNKVTYSEDFTQWTKVGGALIESGYLAPDGSNNAYKVSGTSSSSLYLASITNTTDTRTIWARTVSGTGDVYLCGNLNDANGLFTVTSQWQRFELNGFTGGGATTFYAVDFRGSSTLTEVIIWGAQAEQLSYATSYIPTNGSTVTRLQDAAFGAGSSDLISSTEGVLYAEIAALADDGTNRNISLSKDTGNRVNIFYRNGSNRIRFIVRVNNINVFDTTINLSNITNYSKVALSFKENEFKVYINGVKEAEQLSGSIYPTDTLDKLGFNQNISGGSPFYGKTKCVAVFKEALTDAELTCLTTI